LIDIDPSIDQQKNGLILELRDLIRQPSVSSESYGILECAKLVANLMSEAGLETHLLFLQNKKIAPIVFGEVKSKANSNGKTLLFYNHYDTQPITSISLWKYHLFSGTIIDNKIFGRGSSDDKGELVARVRAIKSYLISSVAVSKE
jgi:acetylornithine deacetylase/succinyl-diaminopimelate desuccinylase-like protein